MFLRREIELGFFSLGSQAVVEYLLCARCVLMLTTHRRLQEPVLVESLRVHMLTDRLTCTNRKQQYKVIAEVLV